MFELGYEEVWQYVQMVLADYQEVMIMLFAVVVAGALIRVFVARRG